MTDEEARAIANRSFAVTQKIPALKLLNDWILKHPNGAREILPIWDAIGCNIEIFEGLTTTSDEKDRKIKEYMDISETLSRQLNEAKKLLVDSKDLLKQASYGPHNSNLGAKIKHFLEYESD
jgi:hypothetical protein